MKHAVAKFILVFAVFTAVFVLQKPLFMGVHSDAVGVESAYDFLTVAWHGLSMDLAVAGYLTVIPGLLIICMLLTPRTWPRRVLDIYIAVCAACISAIFCLDMVLYSYWEFRLDTTPFFYFATSPSAAMASVKWWQALCGAIAFLLIGALMWWGMSRTISIVEVRPAMGWKSVSVTALLTAALIIPIRGSVTVSTMNPSRAYFSQRRGMNHAATNPAFSLLYSATHSNDYATRYRFMEPDRARDLFLSFNADPSAPETEHFQLTTTDRPDIVLVILESFSSHLMPSLGGADVASGLDSIAGSGLLFTDIYASSFRTDRALPAILSALPGQPSQSVLKYIDKIERMPSLPATLASEGYTLAYFYGGDTNFTNMQAYLTSMGFSHIVSDKDFSLSEKASKWGAPDHHVFDRAADYLSGPAPAQSHTVIQTSSSHEPFEVPYTSARFASDERLNAFAYTDSCLTAFVNTLRDAPGWHNTLVVIVPDHFGCWPRNLTDMRQRHRVPLVITGGALAEKGRVAVTGSQTDIAATLLGAMNLPAGAFPFSNDLCRDSARGAFMTDPGSVTVATPGGSVTWNCDADRVEHTTLPPQQTADAVADAKAYLQTLYSYLDSL